MFTLLAIIAVLGLRKLGVNIPYLDNAIYAVKMKIVEAKYNKIQQTFSKNLMQVDKPVDKANRVTKPISTLNRYTRTFSGKLKI